MKTNAYFPEVGIKGCELVVITYNDNVKTLVMELNTTGIENLAETEKLDYAHKIESFILQLLKTEKYKTSILIHSNSHSDNAIKQYLLQMFYDVNIDTQEI